MMWTPMLVRHRLILFSKIMAHFRPKQLVDFSTYNAQILCLTGALICKAHFIDKYNYVQDCEKGMRPPQYFRYCKMYKLYML